MSILGTLSAFAEYVAGLGHADKTDRIFSLIDNVSGITGDSADVVLRSCDFKESEASAEKLEAIIAELRAVVFLSEKGFEGISLLGADKKRRMPDICARLHAMSFDIEVTCLTTVHSRKTTPAGNYPLDAEKFSQRFSSRIKSKRAQLEAGRNPFKMLVFVFNHYPEKALYEGEDFARAISTAYESEKLPENWFLGFVIGSADGDFIYPEIVQ